MGILCDACRRFFSFGSLGLHPKEQNDQNQSVLVGSLKCPLRPILGAKAHDFPFLPEIQSSLCSYRTYGKNLFLDTGLKNMGYLWLRTPHGMFTICNSQSLITYV